ncbi:hypothetical protein VKT23_010748 [Stygiomarasmius scandens]|uniref:Cerato-platanin n=1 Tax=Marasmiellus scandens TaxID=2682957 RepID=A0ABR1JGY5_9AGAR
MQCPQGTGLVQGNREGFLSTYYKGSKELLLPQNSLSKSPLLMKLSATLASVFFLSSFAAAVDLRYDTTYDNPNGGMTTIACSDGSNGLITRYGFQTFGNIPNFPHIGAAQAIAGWNSPQCGTCWTLSYTNGNGQTSSINILAIDHAGSGFNVAQAAMDELTGGNAVAFGRVDVTATQVDVSQCGL